MSNVQRSAWRLDPNSIKIPGHGQGNGRQGFGAPVRVGDWSARSGRGRRTSRSCLSSGRGFDQTGRPSHPCSPAANNSSVRMEPEPELGKASRGSSWHRAAQEADQRDRRVASTVTLARFPWLSISCKFLDSSQVNMAKHQTEVMIVCITPDKSRVLHTPSPCDPCRRLYSP